MPTQCLDTHCSLAKFAGVCCPRGLLHALAATVRVSERLKTSHRSGLGSLQGPWCAHSVQIPAVPGPNLLGFVALGVTHMPQKLLPESQRD